MDKRADSRAVLIEETVLALALVWADSAVSGENADPKVILIAAGGWVEAMYILTNMAEKTQKEDVIGLVGDQKIVLKKDNPY